MTQLAVGTSMSGYEDEAYMEEPSNHGAYGVSTVASYDPRIVPLLDSLKGSAFEKTRTLRTSLPSLAELRRMRSNCVHHGIVAP